MTARFTISLPDEDARFLDAYVRERGLGSRSAGIRAAIRMLGAAGLERDYAMAFGDGDTEDDWDVTTADVE
ncbi:MAG: ribbon-helix-helix domain-containing protein [Rhodococcus sp. (in: high G+C Gram-positive bacteria)]|uniref:ribbon-helix-helix domain-containing protein n=1 Tax=Rhodococcus sp. TaxID=1831 RepID=UPI003BB498A6